MAPLIEKITTHQQGQALNMEPVKEKGESAKNEVVVPANNKSEFVACYRSGGTVSVPRRLSTPSFNSVTSLCSTDANLDERHKWQKGLRKAKAVVGFKEAGKAKDREHKSSVDAKSPDRKVTADPKEGGNKENEAATGDDGGDVAAREKRAPRKQVMSSMIRRKFGAAPKPEQVKVIQDKDGGGASLVAVGPALMGASQVCALIATPTGQALTEPGGQNVSCKISPEENSDEKRELLKEQHSKEHRVVECQEMKKVIPKKEIQIEEHICLARAKTVEKVPISYQTIQMESMTVAPSSPNSEQRARSPKEPLAQILESEEDEPSLILSPIPNKKLSFSSVQEIGPSDALASPKLFKKHPLSHLYGAIQMTTEQSECDIQLGKATKPLIHLCHPDSVETAMAARDKNGSDRLAEKSSQAKGQLDGGKNEGKQDHEQELLQHRRHSYSHRFDIAQQMASEKRRPLRKSLTFDMERREREKKEEEKANSGQQEKCCRKHSKCHCYLFSLDTVGFYALTS